MTIPNLSCTGTYVQSGTYSCCVMNFITAQTGLINSWSEIHYCVTPYGGPEGHTSLQWHPSSEGATSSIIPVISYHSSNSHSSCTIQVKIPCRASFQLLHTNRGATPSIIPVNIIPVNIIPVQLQHSSEMLILLSSRYWQLLLWQDVVH